MIELYCGDGKGKTTAATGLAIRAAGNYIPVVFVQFMKDGSSGELKVLKKIEGVRLLVPDVCFGFVKYMTEEQKRETALVYESLFRQLEQIVGTIETEKRGMLDNMQAVIILDEVTHACNHGLLSKQAVISFLDRYGQDMEIVLTGRDPAEEFRERADYITEMRKVRHPYERGIKARKGIEK